ncbi:hypothetical protein BSKO_00524 [Bryopsis sp. KO-2023]|nr:hypothetical protein BSKO_00524 [Bryopsis sp. KO-2023]
MLAGCLSKGKAINGVARFTTQALSDDLKVSFANCVNLVRTHDYENYIWCMQLDKVDRPAVLAIRAYNVETSLIAERVTKGGAMLREMRYKWWDDTISAIYKGNPPDHPVAKALASVIETRHLTRYRLKKIASTRAKDAVRQGPPETLASIEDYVDGTTGQMMLLQMEAVGVGDVATGEATQFAGKAVGLTSLLRGSIHHAQQGSSYLPKDICDAHGVYMSIMMRGEASDGVRQVVKEVATRAKGYIEQARGLMDDIPKKARPLLLPVTVADMYLDALEKREFNVFDPEWTRKSVWPIWLPIKLKYMMSLGHF